VAQADLAYELKGQDDPALKLEEAQVKIDKEKAIELGPRKSREKELEAMKKPADAMAYQAKLEAEADAYKKELEAKGKAAGIRLFGNAEAEATAAKGEAEARAMLKKAESWSKYNDAAAYETLMRTLPELARAVSEPLSKVEKIVLVGNDGVSGASKITGQVASVIAQLPAIVESLTGTDIKTYLENLPRPRHGRSGERGTSGSESGRSGEKSKEGMID
jgi:flotillin